MDDLAYWITPKGDVLKPSMYHISTIIEHPKKFGETDDTIKATFEKHNEPVSKNSEGFARSEIITRVLGRGFIRIRKHTTRRFQGWSVELVGLNNRKLDYIQNWAKEIVDKKMTRDIYADVKITDVDPRTLRINKAMDSYLNDVAQGIFEGDNKLEIKTTLTLLANNIRRINPVYIKEEDCAHELDDWFSYAGKIDIDGLSEEAIIQIYVKKISGGA
jgi:hypothetical protein